MPAPEPAAGWGWFEAPAGAPEEADELARSAAACLGSPPGRRLLRHLERTFLERRVPPTASDAELRHAEGQRSVVGHLLRLVERGRQAPDPRTNPVPDAGVSP